MPPSPDEDAISESQTRRRRGPTLNPAMPVLSKFCGVVVGMLFVPVLGAHFHAFYGDHELMVSIPSLAIIQGEVPEPIRRLILAWARCHQAALLRAWGRCADHLRPETIPPLA
jgi:hypothetical protein